MCMMTTKDDYVVVDNVGEVDDGPLACEDVTTSNLDMENDILQLVIIKVDEDVFFKSHN